jgi:hypothetical protein
LTVQGVFNPTDRPLSLDFGGLRQPLRGHLHFREAINNLGPVIDVVENGVGGCKTAEVQASTCLRSRMAGNAIFVDDRFYIGQEAGGSGPESLVAWPLSGVTWSLEASER